MAGRPKLEDSRNNQYRVRLNDDENEMLNYVSYTIGKPKSEVFRHALTELYHKIRLAEARKDFEDEEEISEPTWEDEHVSLKRAIDCPYCGYTHMMDFKDDCETSSSERSMGPDIVYEFDLNECYCENCGRLFRVKGFISEYPMGCYDNEEIYVEPLEDIDDDEEDD